MADVVAHDAGRTRVARWKPFLADLALAGLFAAIVLLLTVSAPLLDRFGYHYFTPGGAPWEKFHPGTLVAIAALGARILAAGDPLPAAGRLLGGDRLLLLFVLAVALTAAHAALVSRTPVTGFVDTFLLPVILLVLLRGLQADLRRRLALLVCALLALNACVGIVENLSGWRLVPIDVPEGVTGDPTRLDLPFDARAALALDWRASAFLGHPLENAVVTGAFILCLAAPGAGWLSGKVRIGLIGFAALAMIAFGGRASLVLSLAGATLFLLYAGARALLEGRLRPRRLLAGALLGLPVLVAAFLGALASGFLDRTLERFANDSGSSNARIVMWQLFEPQSWSNLLLGPDQGLVQTWQRLLGIEFGIESFWLGFALTYGLIFTAILVCGLGLLCLRVVSVSGAGAAGILLYFFLVGSTSTSLSSKTVGFTNVIMLIALLLPRDQYQPFPRRLA